ncbi:hypothetical protein ACHAXS_001466 [Conticribra weissflogii]
MARAEPSIVIPRPANGDAPQMGTNAEHDEPLGLQGTIVIRLLITKLRERHGRLRGDFGGGTMANKDWLATPLDCDSFPGLDAPHVEFGGGEGEDVRGGAHRGDKLDDENAGSGGVGEADSGEEEVGECATFGFGDAVDAVVFEGVVDGAELVERRSFEGREGGGNVGGLEALGETKGGGGGSEARREDLGRGPGGEAGGEAKGVHGCNLNELVDRWVGGKRGGTRRVTILSRGAGKDDIWRIQPSVHSKSSDHSTF